MSLAEKFRWFPVPGYGVCGGADRSCVYENMDPLDKLFYQHDQNMYNAGLIENQEERKVAEKKADAMLEDGLISLSNKDMKKIPLWIWKPPFFKRWYAKLYRREAIKVFAQRV